MSVLVGELVYIYHFDYSLKGFINVPLSFSVVLLLPHVFLPAFVTLFICLRTGELKKLQVDFEAKLVYPCPSYS